MARSRKPSSSKQTPTSLTPVRKAPTATPRRDTPLPARPVTTATPPAATPSAGLPRPLFALGAVALVALGWWGLRGGAQEAPQRVAEVSVPAVEAGVEGADVAETDPGYWGDVSARDISLRQPAGYVEPGECDRMQPDWIFSHTTAEQVVSRFVQAGVTEAERDVVRAATHCSADGCYVRPPPFLLGGMAPPVRRAVMHLLAQQPENELYRFPFRRGRRFEPWATLSWLRPEVRSMFARLSFTDNEDEVVADFPFACRELPDDEARQQFMEAVKMRYGVEATLRVDGRTPIEPLVRWYGYRGDRAALRQTLLAARDRGIPLPLQELLPPMPRARYNTFPGRQESPFDCFWTALHFFSRDPREAEDPPGNDGMMRAIHSRYRRVTIDDLRFGDVLLFVDSAGAPVHSVNVITPSIVYSKNGGSFRRPWVIQRLDDVRALYPNIADVQPWRLRS